MSLFAYLDPGSGSLMIQVLIAALVGATFYFHSWVVAPIRVVWRRLFGSGSDAAPVPDQEVG